MSFHWSLGTRHMQRLHVVAPNFDHYPSQLSSVSKSILESKTKLKAIFLQHKTASFKKKKKEKKKVPDRIRTGNLPRRPPPEHIAMDCSAPEGAEQGPLRDVHIQREMPNH